MKPDDVDVLMGYDSFTITALLHLEDLGFCKKGEGGPFVADGHLGPGGTLAMNTNGGGLSFTHPGMYGMFLLTEATRQLRGECGERQVDGADGRGRARLGDVPLRHVDGRARHGGDAVSDTQRGRPARFEPPVGVERGGLLGGHPRGPVAGAVVHGVRPGRLLPAGVLPAFCSGDRSLEWRDASGRATVYAAGVEHRPEAAGATFSGGQPYCVALVDLEEGVRMLTNVVGCPPDEVHSGMAVTVTWEPLQRRAPAPALQPASGGVERAAP